MNLDANPRTAPASGSSFLLKGGALGDLIRAFDWSSTSLGPIESWSQSLKTVTAMLLLSPVPIVLLWGETGVMIYNDAYSEFAGGKHPGLLGTEVRSGWPEVADFNDNVMKVGLGGGTLAYRNQELILYRNGQAERVWMNLDYSPVPDESGRPAGVIAIVVETTKQVLAERQVKAEQTRLTSLFEQAPGLMAMLSGPDHIFELANPAYMQLVGQRDILGKPFLAALPEVEDQGFVELLDDVYRSGAAFVGHGIEVKLYRTPGQEAETRTADFVFQPVTDADGRVTGIFVEGYDVTERASAVAALRQNESRLRFLDILGKETAKSTEANVILATTARLLGEHLDVSVCAYADMEPDEDVFTIRGDWSSPGAASIVGRYSLATFGSLAVRNLHAGVPLILNDNRAQLPAKEAATFLDLGLAATICMPLVKEGRLTALMAVHDQAPREWKPHELAIVREVTERSWAHIERVRSEAAVRLGEQRFRLALEEKVAERTAELAQSQAHIRTIFESSHLYQGLLDVDGTILHSNAISLVGIHATLEDVIGLPFWDSPWFTGTPGMSEAVKAAVAKVATGGTQSFNMTVSLPTGIRSFEFSLRPVRDDTGKVVALLPEAVENTARLKAEQALHQFLKMEALGNLTGGIAHDFNNLLMVVLGNLELLRKRIPDDPSLLKLLDNAKAGADRGASLTSRMLAFARKQDLRSELIDLPRLIEDMRELLKSSLGSTIAIETRFPTQLAVVETDPNQLESALLNLAVNARDAMDGQGKIIISVDETSLNAGEHGLTAGRYVRLSIIDSGHGMDGETLQRATEPFFTTKGIGKGTGLGLSMVHGLAQQSGGTLTLTSMPGQGTTADIWLPAQERHEAAPAVPPDVNPAPHALPDAVTLRILAVDDDELVLTNTADMLRDQGHQVLMARSGPEALELLNDIRFDLVITDHAMPSMTGIQLASEIQAHQPDVPIILVSGYLDLPSGAPIDLTRLSKPFSQRDLMEAVALATAADP